MEAGKRRLAGDTARAATTDEVKELRRDAYFGRAKQIHAERARIKRQTIEHRRLQHRKLAA